MGAHYTIRSNSELQGCLENHGRCGRMGILWLAAAVLLVLSAGMVVSLNTVRFHVKEIYGKLGVNRQAQAVARAWEVGVL